MGLRCYLVRIMASVATAIGRIWAPGVVLTLTIFLFVYWGGFLATGFLIIAILGLLYQAEDHLLYHPEQPNHSRIFVPIPSLYNLPFESIFTRSYDGTILHLFLIKQSDDRIRNCPTILYFHGNAGNMGHRLGNVAGLFHHLGCNVLMLEYRGYGLSGGSPSESGLCMDARSALDYLRSRNDINIGDIVLFGRSLGGAVAIDLASRVEHAESIRCLIVENTFTSIPDMAKVLLNWPILNYLPLFFYKNQFLSINKIKSLRIPCLFVSGLQDALVPPKMMADLYSMCGSEMKHLAKFKAGTHNETWSCAGYYPQLSAFLRGIKTQTTTLNEHCPSSIVNVNNSTDLIDLGNVNLSTIVETV